MVLAFPLAGALINGLGFKWLPGRSAGWLGTAAIFLSFLASVGMLVQVLDVGTEGRHFTSSLYDYASAAGIDIQMNILVDPLSTFMCLVVSGVSALIHLYSVSYMASDRGVAIAICCLLMVGAFAKSAQVPLHTWLPDAMEGPTPVSALIHAATMVTAGVYMLVRLNPIFAEAESIQDLAAGIGAVTLLMAGLIALVQTDIKRVIAYSTMSQIGYMFLAAGITAYGPAMFHLMTHAFFKALLFLAAGIVIHALVAEQDMRRMGGLRKQLPKTYAVTLIGALALAGIPPLSGFFSKDAVLASALDAGLYGQILWAAGLAGAFLTALYTFRMIFIVFWGEPSPYAREHFHAPKGTEPNVWMAWTVGLLALLSVVGGWFQVAGLWETITEFIEPVAETHVKQRGLEDHVTSVIAVGLALAGIYLAWAVYVAAKIRVPDYPALQHTLEKKFYWDEAYDLAFYRPAVWIANGFYRWVERPLIAGSIQGLTYGARFLSSRTGEVQTGLTRTYVFALGAGVAVLALVFLAVRG